MPKRSNTFQRAIRHISEALVPGTARVRESVELPEMGLNEKVLREIDVLVEQDMGISTVRVAVECRDSKRRASVQWIDALDGKYRHLDVDQVIAVSKSGFTKAALQKAYLTKVRPMTPQDVQDEDWPGQFKKLGIARVLYQFILAEVQIKMEPPMESYESGFQVEFEDSTPTDRAQSALPLTIGEVIEELRPHLIASAKSMLKAESLKVYKTVADLRKDAILYWDIPIDEVSLRHPSGSVHRVISLRPVVRVKTKVENITLNQMSLDDKALVTTGWVPGLVERDVETEISIVQTAGQHGARIIASSNKKGGA